MTRTAAVLFFLWGLIHVLGGAVMLATLGDGGPEAYLLTVATVDPGMASSAPEAGGASAAVFGFHAWNILWVGLCVAVLAGTLNWRGSPIGYWVNLALISGADLGLLVFLVLPGIMAWSTASPGLGLWLPAAVTGFLALRGRAAPEAGVRGPASTGPPALP